MGTVSSLIDLARQTMMADEFALNVVGNNVANVNTPGYTRETVAWETRDSVTINGSIVGQGVSVGTGGVSQRDRILEQRVHQQTQTVAQSTALQTALSEVQDVFGLSATSTSASSTALGSAIDNFFGSLSTLTTNPSDSATRQAVITAANNLANAFNNASGQLTSISADLNQQVSDSADQVNHLTSTIASLNQQITSLSPDADAGTLEDQRQQAIAELSQYIGLNQITNESNGMTLTTTNGAVLVSGSQSYDMTASSVDGVVHLLAGPNQTDITAGVTGGSLGGILVARDQMIPEYQSSLDQLAYTMATSINQANEQGLDGSGAAGQAIFSIPGTATGAASQIQLATTDPQAVAAAAIGEGTTGTGNALAMAGLASDSIVSGQTPVGFYASLLAQIGDATADATNDVTEQQATLDQLTTQRNSISSVSLDEEAANLDTYQRSYQAAAKVFSIADQIMASALNLGVETSVS